MGDNNNNNNSRNNNNINSELNNLFDLGKISNLLGLGNTNQTSQNKNRNNNNNMGLNFSNPLKSLGKLFGNGQNNQTRRYRCNVNILPIEEAYRKIKSGTVFLLDVRTEMEYKTIRIKGSVNIPIDKLQSDIGRYNLNKQDAIIIYCSVGTRTRRAIQILWSMGYTNLCIWEGGGLNTFAFQDLIVYNGHDKVENNNYDGKVE